MIYALIKDAIVQNVVVCDDDDSAKELFADFTVINIDGLDVGIGWGYEGDSFIAPPPPETPPEEIAAGRLNTAQAEYDRATDEINKRNEQIDDSDYDGTTEDAVKAELAEWTQYRKELRSYIKNNDGTVNLPSSPEK